MKSTGILIASTAVVLLTVVGISRCERKFVVKEEYMLSKIKNVDDLRGIFPKTPSEISQLTDAYIEQVKQSIQAIIDIPADQRTFENTAQAFDLATAHSNLELLGAACSVLKEVSPDEAIRNAARDAIMKMVAFSVEWISGNVDLYKAFKEYAEGNAKTERLRDDQRYFNKETLDDFKRAGLDLPEKELERVKQLNKEIVGLSLVFQTNTGTDNRTITVDRTGLAGLEDDFINALKRTDDGQYILGIDYPTYFTVIENCAVEDTRKRLGRAFNNKGYPANKQVLETIIAKRDELATILGYKSFAHLNIDDEMLQSPERVQKLLDSLLPKLKRKDRQEFELMKKHLPESVTLNQDGVFYPWDYRFVMNEYKKQHLAVNEEKLAEYFQLEYVLEKMFELYARFFGVRFEFTQEGGFWHPEVKLVKVLKKDSDDLLAYLLLDLHPRDNKFGHAANFGILTGLRTEENGWPSVSFVVANFPKSTEEKPSLLKRRQVETLFHEFGHAMHGILGRTYLASFAGARVKRDFVEVPSQTLEEWLWDSQVLTMLSKHYKTGEPLSEEQIEKIIALKQFDRGWFWLRQLQITTVALAYYAPGAQKDLDSICNEIDSRISPHTAVDPEAHFYAQFGHLTSYGARYYSYIWSKLLSQDVFEHIKQQGLFESGAGERYVKVVLEPGGSKDPAEIMREFLGREPNDKAFCKAMGLS